MKHTSLARICGIALLAGGFVPSVPGQTSSVAADRIVVSGFEPFGGRSENASWTLVQEIKKAFPSILDRQIPVVWGAPLKAIAAEKNSPDVWIAFGEGTPAFQIEVLAHNRRGGFPDNQSRTPSAPLIVQDGAAELKNKIAAAALAARLTAAGFPTRESTNAGAYLCEEMLYSLLHFQARQPDGFRLVLFVHVPVLGKAVARAPAGTVRGSVTQKVDAAYLAAFGRQLFASLQEIHQIRLSENSAAR
ncbi:MAG TPA: hypothetical protein PLB55_20470 [Prosthecobacter sp.]|jgi:pyroglutamyl-peptidase|nr:hypothetical protein [Prosthecobacter sp.]